MRRLYIYYRIPAARAAEAHAAVCRYHRDFRERDAELQLELLRRPGEKDGLQTWMEVCTRPGGIDETLQSRLVSRMERELAGLLQGGLHVEVFVPCAS